MLEIKGLCKGYAYEDGGRNEVFKDFNLSVSDSCKTLALLGPDGAGKSTLLGLIAGVIKPDKGEIKLGGMRPDTSDLNFTQKIGYMSQTLGLYEELSAIENLNFFAGLKGVDTSSNSLAELLEKVGLGAFATYQAGSLSGGMKQKLALACALAANPAILVLDEPTVGVDPLSREELWAVARDYAAKEGAVCIFSTAYLDEAASADEVLVIHDGKITAKGVASEITTCAKGRTWRVNGLSNFKFGALALTFSTKIYDKNSVILDVVPRGGGLDILADKSASEGELISNLNKILGDSNFKLTSREPTLEDAYIDVTQDFSHVREPEIRISNLNVDNSNLSDEITVDVHEIQKKFGSFTAVEKSDFKVKKGEIFGLLGPNGAGKTTTFRMICALLNPTAGRVLVAGRDLMRDKTGVRAKIGYVSQKFSLYKKLTVRQNMEYFGRSYGVSGDELGERIERLMADFGLTRFADMRAAKIPFGASRNLSMVCALIHRPRILFLDESTSGADASARRAFWNRINALASGGMSVVVTTHFMEEAEYCDRFLIQDHGRILALGTPEEICTKNGSRVSVEEAFKELVREFRKQNG